VRPVVKEQVESLGAKFLAVEDEEFKQAETAGGYAKEMSKEYQAKQAALTAEHIKKQDIIITTALIPGRPAPRLVTSEMVKSMKRGSVLVDLAVERGGNVSVDASRAHDLSRYRRPISAAFALRHLDRRSVVNIINSMRLHVGVVTGAAIFDLRRSEIPCQRR
jgi:Alanine dehydrogenase/PNT, C-terminal domain